MPSYFQLVSKETGEPATLQAVDREICQFLGLEEDPDCWCEQWYRVIGAGLAMGRTFSEIRELCPDYEDIVDFLDARYTSRAWWEPK